MRRNLLFLLVAAVFVSAPAIAAVTVEETTDAEQLINNGYSQAMAEQVFVVKNRATAKPIEPLYEKNQNKAVKLWRKFYAYVDPAQDAEDRIHHDIKLAPDVSDL